VQHRRRVGLVVSVLAACMLVPAAAGAATLVFRGSIAADGTAWAEHTVDVSASGPLEASLEWTGAQADLNLLLYDPAGSIAAWSLNTGAEPERLAHGAAEPGTWRVGVHAIAGEALYRLTVTTPDPPAPVVVDLAPAAGIAAPTETFSANVEDVSGDGMDDLLLVRHWQDTAQLLRQEAGAFAPWAEFPLADRHDCASADVDGDGLRDVYCSLGATEPGGESSAEKANELWLQAPDGTFADVATAWGVADPYGRGRDVAFLDANGDGLPDLFVGNGYPRPDARPSPNRLFLNDGGIRFVERPEAELTDEHGAWCAVPADVDGDGWTDLLVCGAGATAGAPLRLFRNLAGTAFAEVRRGAGIRGSAVDAALADLDGDGVLDLASINARLLRVQLGRGDGTFAPPTVVRTLVAGVDLAVVDLDRDGDGDLYAAQSCGIYPSDQPDVLLLNDGDALGWRELAVPGPDAGCGDGAEPLTLVDRPAVLVINGRGRAAGPVQLLALDGVSGGTRAGTPRP
jgi:hypothetical protein